MNSHSLSTFKFFILSVVFVCISILCQGDALPHGYQHYKFKAKLNVDSIIVITSDDSNFSSFDTVAYNPRRKVIECFNNSCSASGNSHDKYQQLIIYANGERILSNIFQPEGSNPTFLVEQNNYGFKVTETTSFLFRGTLGEILRALIITIVLELLVALFFFGIKRRPKTFLLIILINLITIPAAWLSFPLVLNLLTSYELFTNGVVLTFVYEFMIVVIEFIGLWLMLSEYTAKRIAGFVIVANMISFVVGGFLYVFTIFL